MGYKAAVQVLKKAESLKQRISLKDVDLLNDLQAWTDQQQLQTIYHQVLVLDLEYALDKKVEQELWMLGFKKHISKLQEQARDKKNLRRLESQALLSWCLEAASGFYLTLLQELCTTYDLDLPFRKRGPVFGKLRNNNYNEVNLPQSSSCLYICQYCLVHLGDIARYRNQRKQAESFYKHAILVSPNSGHPYNQLALLEASQNDKLATVFNYVRGIAVKNPFPGASLNLANTLMSATETDETLSEVQTKMSLNEFISLFLRVHGLLHSDIDVKQAELCVKSINATLTALVATQSFTTEKLIKISIINMYALRHTTGDNLMNVDELTDTERKVRELILELIAGSLSAFLLPIYTLKNDETLLDYYALPAIRLILMWIRSCPLILTDSVFKNRLQIWPGYCRLLNSIQASIKKEDYAQYSKTPLSHDRELQGFLPLHESLKNYNFKLDVVDAAMEKHVRAHRLVDFAKWLTSHDLDGTKLIICKERDDSEFMDFEPACIQPDPTDQLLEEMKSFAINESESKAATRKGGILKPQGSLEKAREERGVQLKINNDETLPNTQQKSSDISKLKRVSAQNVALQSIYKKIEESKQVKFSAETTEKEKTSPKAKPIQQRIMPPPQNNTYRPPPQAFNQQNHIPFGNNDILNLPKIQPNVGYSLPPQSSMPFNTANQPPSGNTFTPCIEKPMQFNCNYNYNNEERAWWPTQQTQQDYYRFNSQFGPTGNEMFNSPWRNTNTNMNMSMRQTMLNESKSSNNLAMNNSPGYSLFNTTSWTPALPGRSSNNNEPRQQSLFTSSAPQSLQQLLEQQNQLQKGDT